mmetsp:Transcript_13176/g.51532  ORF Transcript_13176/g.51532 Transcript_13176/m.51532 type:complete len:282 (-) Transcript_13176:125-970(-)
MTSGAIQYGVPLMLLCTPSTVTISASLLLAPKSASFTQPWLSTRMFAPFMSLCMIWCLCRYSSPSNICRVYTRMTLSPKLPNRCSSEWIEPPLTYSMKMVNTSSLVRSVPKYDTIFGCLSRRMSATSCSIRRTLSSAARSFSSANASSRPVPWLMSTTLDILGAIAICFTASIPPVSRSRPTYTRPKPPLPTSSPLCHRMVRSSESSVESSSPANSATARGDSSRDGLCTISSSSTAFLGLRVPLDFARLSPSRSLVAFTLWPSGPFPPSTHRTSMSMRSR